MAVESVISSLGYFGIFCLMLVNGVIGLPSSSVLYLFCGFLVISDVLSLLPVVTTGTVGNVIGNVILYELSRRKGVVYVMRWKVFSGKNMLKLQRAFAIRGFLIIFVGKLLSGVKVFIPVVAGVAEMNRVVYVIFITITSLLWASALTLTGCYLGNNYHDRGFDAWSVLPVFAVLVVIVLFVWYIRSIPLV